MVVPSIMIMDYVCMCRDVRVCRSLLHVAHTHRDVPYSERSVQVYVCVYWSYRNIMYCVRDMHALCTYTHTHIHQYTHTHAHTRSHSALGCHSYKFCQYECFQSDYTYKHTARMPIGSSILINVLKRQSMYSYSLFILI